MPMWDGTEHEFRDLWDRVLKLLGLWGMGLLPAGLRGGGAIFDLLSHRQNVPRVTRRGRWQKESTLEHYAQEGFALLTVHQAPPAAQTLIGELAALAPRIFGSL